MQKHDNLCEKEEFKFEVDSKGNLRVETNLSNIKIKNSSHSKNKNVNLGHNNSV
jgi:hypothetical protein